MTIHNWLSKLNRRDTRLLPNFSKLSKVLLFVLISISLVTFTTKVFAIDATDFIKTVKIIQVIQENQVAVNEGGNQESWLDHAMISNILSFIRLLTGQFPEKFSLVENSNYVPGGAIGTATNLVASTFTPAASGIQYVAQMKDNFLGKPAYAQNNGVGFNTLAPLLPLWTGFRNLIYIFSSLIFVIIGIMIMFRFKISAQAVVSIQNAIPQLITTLILVTFSYAIAGLLIDFMNFFQAAVLMILFNFNGSNLQNSIVPVRPQIQHFADTFSWITTGHFFNPFSYEDLANHNGLFQTFGLIAQLIPWEVLFGFGMLMGAIVGAIVTFPAMGAGAPLGAILGPVVMLVVLLIIIFYNLIVLLFGLIRTYITVIIKIIFAPLEIGMGAFPNSKLGFNSWLYDMIAHLAVFPSVVIFLVLLNIITVSIAGGIWTPPILGTGGGLFTSAMLGAMVGIGGLMLLARLPHMIPEFIFSIKPSPWGTAIGQGLTEHRGFPGQLFNRAQQIGEGAYNLNNFGADVRGRGIGNATRAHFNRNRPAADPGAAADAAGRGAPTPPQNPVVSNKDADEL